MATEHSDGTSSNTALPDDEFTDFLSLLNELKATGCNLLLVGDARPELFTRASENLLGDTDTTRYRLFGVTDSSYQTVAERFPDPAETPHSLAETSRIVNYGPTPRSISTRAGDSDPLERIPERQVTDADLEAFESELVTGIEDLSKRAYDLRPADLRVGIDSVGPLFEDHDDEEIRRCLRTVGEHVRDRNGMAHYVLKDGFDSDRVRTLADDVDAVIELRSVDPSAYDHDAQQRWHVPGRDLTTNWVRL